MAEPFPPLATPQQVADYSAGTIISTDPRLGDMLDGVSAAIRRYCGWHITPSVDSTVTLDGPGTPELDLPSLHVTAVASITECDQVIDPTLWTWSELGQVRLHRGRFTHHYRAITAEFTHGYDYAPELTQVVLSAVARMLAAPSGNVQERAGDVLVKHAETATGAAGGLVFLQPEYQVLDSYRIVGA